MDQWMLLFQKESGVMKELKLFVPPLSATGSETEQSTQKIMLPTVFAAKLAPFVTPESTRRNPATLPIDVPFFSTVTAVLAVLQLGKSSHTTPPLASMHFDVPAWMSEILPPEI